LDHLPPRVARPDGGAGDAAVVAVLELLLVLALTMA
jgi:hypothetical protein